MEITNHSSGPKQIDIYNLFVSIKLWFNYLLRKWWLICIVVLLSGSVGFFIAWLDKPTYQSHLTFALEDGEGGLGGALSLAAEFGFNLGNSGNLFEGDNILSLLTSRRIVERTLLSVDTIEGKPITMADYIIKLTEDSTKKKSIHKMSPNELRLSKVSFPPYQPRSNFSYLQDSVLINVYKDFVSGGMLKVGKPDKKLNLYEISVTTPNERFSKIFTDKLIKEATDFYVELKTKRSKETLAILEARVNLTKGNLNQAINNRADIQDANVNPVFQETQARIQQKQVDISAYGGAYGELYKNLEVARFQYLKDKPLLQVIDAADYPMTLIRKGKALTAILYAIIAGVFMVFILTLIYVVSSAYIKNYADDKPIATFEEGLTTPS